MPPWGKNRNTNMLNRRGSRLPNGELLCGMAVMERGKHLGKVPSEWTLGCGDVEAPVEDDRDARSGGARHADCRETASAIAARSVERSRALNVVFVTVADLPEGGGNTTRLKMLATAVSNCGHQVVMLNEHGLGVAPRELLKRAGRIGDVEYRYILDSVDRQFGWRAMAPKLAAVFSLIREIMRRHRQKPIDVLWFNNLSFYDVYPLTRLAQHLGIRTIQSYEDERLELITPYRSLSQRLFAVNSKCADRFCPQMADAVVVISEYLKHKYQGRAARTYLVPTIVDCHYWEVGPEPCTDTPVLLYAGCFDQQEELNNLIAALALLRDRDRRFRAVFVGAHREANRVGNVLSAIRERRLETRVEMRGFMPLDEVRENVAQANLLLNIRRDGIWSRSGLSTKLSEYLASGRTVIATDLGDVSRYLRHNHSALLVPASATTDQIATAIEQGLASRELRARIGEEGRKVAWRHFDIAVVKKTLDLILHASDLRVGDEPRSDT